MSITQISNCSQIRSSVSRPSSSPFLVYITDNSDPSNGAGLRGILDPETGEIRPVEYDYDGALSERYMLQDVASSLLSGGRGPRHRIQSCLRLPVDSRVQVRRSVDGERVRYGKLAVCGSLHVCPVCAATITEARAHQINEILESHKAAGGSVYLLTFTFRHGLGDDLSVALRSASRAFDLTMKSAAGKRVMRSSVGYVRSLEVTFGHVNGWHPHYHVLLFSDGTLTASEIKSLLYPVWRDRCVSCGLGEPSWDRGLDVRGGMSAAEYVAKWGRERLWTPGREMTKGTVKKGRLGRYTPFDLLRLARGGEVWAADRFVEWSKASKGVRTITFSRGLRDLYSVDDSADSDRQIAEHGLDESYIVLSELSKREWRLICDANLRSSVLIVARSGGALAVRRLIRAISRASSKSSCCHRVSSG
jgi:hypothetical protein